jgi:hypothetical protein
MTEGAATVCQWCEKPFRARRGGSPQRFCGARCRMMFWSALRRWGERAVAAGMLTIAEVRYGDPTACTLHPGRVSPTPVNGEAPLLRPAPGAPRGESGDARQKAFEQLLARTIAARRR